MIRNFLPRRQIISFKTTVMMSKHGTILKRHANDFQFKVQFMNMFYLAWGKCCIMCFVALEIHFNKQCQWVTFLETLPSGVLQPFKRLLCLQQLNTELLVLLRVKLRNKNHIYKSECFLKVTVQSSKTALTTLSNSTPNLSTVCFCTLFLKNCNTIMKGLKMYPSNVIKYSF